MEGVMGGWLVTALFRKRFLFIRRDCHAHVLCVTTRSGEAHAGGKISLRSYP